MCTYLVLPIRGETLIHASFSLPCDQLTLYHHGVCIFTEVLFQHSGAFVTGIYVVLDCLLSLLLYLIVACVAVCVSRFNKTCWTVQDFIMDHFIKLCARIPSVSKFSTRDLQSFREPNIFYYFTCYSARCLALKYCTLHSCLNGC